MPLGFERINERQQRPNALINFIKPLEGPDRATSLEFLSRIAAQCYPVMKKHHISVMALEEHEQNPEFLGRNFNAGEVIQLVLKDRQGRWLSMKFVQMVMMHELAHCKQMNHSRFFWVVRNDYAKQMEDLWRDGYLGDGMWGRGRGLENGAFVSAAPPDNTQIPAHLCGGSYRRRGKKRKRGLKGQNQSEKLTYAERQQRRIARKFGKHGDGESLGDDELVRGALESMNGGKRGHGKPRVANSKRGRELRAAAALARFEHAQRATPEQASDLEDNFGSETESDWEEDTASTSARESVVISDERGRDLVKVCGDGKDDEEGAEKELDELRMLSATPTAKSKSKQLVNQPPRGRQGHMDPETESEAEDDRGCPTTRTAIAQNSQSTEVLGATPRVTEPHDDRDNASELVKPQPLQQKRKSAPSETGTSLCAFATKSCRELDASNAASQSDDEDLESQHVTSRSTQPIHVMKSKACPICSMENDLDTSTCFMCAHVLRPDLISDHWRCISEACKGSTFIHAGDAGRCSACGAAKSNLATLSRSASDSRRQIGITRPEVLRWD